LNRPEEMRAPLRPEEVVALRDAATNDAISPVGTFRRTRDAAIVREGKKRDLHD